MTRLKVMTQTTWACDRCLSTEVTDNNREPRGWYNFWFCDTDPRYRNEYGLPAKERKNRHMLYCQHCTAHLEMFFEGHATPERTGVKR